jgi:hypothetical protein
MLLRIPLSVIVTSMAMVLFLPFTLPAQHPQSTDVPTPSIAELLHAALLAEEAGAGFGGPNLLDKEQVLALGYEADAEKVWARLQGQSTAVPGIVIAVRADQIQLAVSQDAINAGIADFLVAMRNPLTEAQLKVIRPGFQFRVPPDQSLTATYDNYKRVPSSGKRPASVEILLKDGTVVPAKTNAAPQPPALHASGHP